MSTEPTPHNRPSVDLPVGTRVESVMSDRIGVIVGYRDDDTALVEWRWIKPHTSTATLCNLRVASDG